MHVRLLVVGAVAASASLSLVGACTSVASDSPSPEALDGSFEGTPGGGDAAGYMPQDASHDADASAPLWPTCGQMGVLHPANDVGAFGSAFVGTWRRCGDPVSRSADEVGFRVDTDGGYTLLASDGDGGTTPLGSGTIGIIALGSNIFQVNFILADAGASTWMASGAGVLADTPRTWHADENGIFDYRYIDWDETKPAPPLPTPPDGGWPAAGSSVACHSTPGATRSFASLNDMTSALAGTWERCSGVPFRDRPGEVGLELRADGRFGLMYVDEKDRVSTATDIDHAGWWALDPATGPQISLHFDCCVLTPMNQTTVTDAPVFLSTGGPAYPHTFVAFDSDAGL
jgi:hypothetical protein